MKGQAAHNVYRNIAHIHFERAQRPNLFGIWLITAPPDPAIVTRGTGRRHVPYINPKFGYNVPYSMLDGGKAERCKWPNVAFVTDREGKRCFGPFNDNGPIRTGYKERPGSLFAE